jgi:hypothetical protein
MRRLAPPLAVLALAVLACNDAAQSLPPPMDEFFFPSGVALFPVAGGNSAMLVASSNYDLHYDKNNGATVLSVDPRPAEDGGSARPNGGALVMLGPGARVGSYTGPVALVDATNCPSNVGPVTPLALVASRLNRELYVLPVGADGSVAPCSGDACVLPLFEKIYDPFSVTVACRSDGQRRRAYVGYLRTPYVVFPSGLTVPSGVAWLTELDLDDLAGPHRDFPMGSGPVIAAAYDGLTDRLFAVGRAAGPSAPVFVVSLRNCAPSDTSCGPPPYVTIELAGVVRGADLSGIALSNPQPGLARRAYVTARIYDADLALQTGVRPAGDIGGVLLVLDLTENSNGIPSMRLINLVDVGTGPGQVTVLPVRPPDGATPRRDLVVLTNTAEGLLTVYDDDLGGVVRVFALDEYSGQPLAGRSPYALAVEPALLGTSTDPTARVYVGSFSQNMVSLVDVPVLTPGASTLYTGSGTTPYRIGTVGP